MQNLAKGLGFYSPALGLAGGGGTAAAANSGLLNINLNFNSIGTTLWGTLVELQKPTGLGQTFMHGLYGIANGANVLNGLAYVYKIGTLVLTGTGNQLTHDAATFPVKRTRLGQASNALNLIPLITITTATTVTAPAFIIRNATGPSTGYVNQAGTAIQGTKTFTFPAAATGVGSTYVMRLEEGDSAVQDITKIDMQTAGSAGAATIWGMEILSVINTLNNGPAGFHDSLVGGLHMQDMAPAVAASGTATSYLVQFSFSSNSLTVQPLIWGATNS